jgi:hypothetical protein
MYHPASLVGDRSAKRVGSSGRASGRLLETWATDPMVRSWAVCREIAEGHPALGAVFAAHVLEFLRFKAACDFATCSALPNQSGGGPAVNESDEAADSPIEDTFEPSVVLASGIRGAFGLAGRVTSGRVAVGGLAGAERFKSDIAQTAARSQRPPRSPERSGQYLGAIAQFAAPMPTLSLLHRSGGPVQAPEKIGERPAARFPR